MDGYQLGLLCVCGVRLFLGVVSMVIGCVELSLYIDNFQWPNNSAVAIWAGAVSVVISIIGIILSCKELVAEKFKRLAIYCGFLNGFSFSVGIMHMVFSFVLVGQCAKPAVWCVVDHPAKAALGAVSGTLGLSMLALAVPTSYMIYCVGKQHCSGKTQCCSGKTQPC